MIINLEEYRYIKNETEVEKAMREYYQDEYSCKLALEIAENWEGRRVNELD